MTIYLERNSIRRTKKLNIYIKKVQKILIIMADNN